MVSARNGAMTYCSCRLGQEGTKKRAKKKVIEKQENDKTEGHGRVC